MTMIATNTASYDIRTLRENLFSWGVGLDAKRPAAWEQYGWKEVVTFTDLLTAYQRGGAGHGAVHRLLGGCWQKLPRIKQPEADKETLWEKKTGAMLKAVGAWRKLRDFDRRNMVGRFSALIYRVADGLELREPMVTAVKLVDLVPVYEDQIQVTKWNQDKTSPDYAKPEMFQIRTRSLGASQNTQAKPEEWLDVHPSRVQILAEGSVGDMFDGVPLLLAGFNHLSDIEKIGGGSAESFLKNSARTVVFEYDPQAQVAASLNEDGTTKSVRETHEEQTRALNRNQDSSIVMQGGKATTLQTTVSDPTGSFQLAANLFSASVQIPFTILFGQQTGRLASDEDKADMQARCKSRQENELTPMLTEFIQRMQSAGLIEAGEFEIEWPDLAASSDDEKFALLDKACAAMQKAFQAGITEPLFDANELRKIAGFEPRKVDGMPGEGGDPTGDPATDPKADPKAAPKTPQG